MYFYTAGLESNPTTYLMRFAGGFVSGRKDNGVTKIENKSATLVSKIGEFINQVASIFALAVTT